jgi:hypothetical protein
MARNVYIACKSDSELNHHIKAYKKENSGQEQEEILPVK